MIDALITDFDGVVVDSEPLHFRGFAAVLAREGIVLTWYAYASTYMALDDHDCFLAVAADQGRTLTADHLTAMIDAKSLLVQDMIGQEIQAFPGVREFLAATSEAHVPMAICSGCLRVEVELASQRLGIWDWFQAAVTARDVTRGKPSPEGYLLALTQLREITGRNLQADRCVVVEDSPGGVASGKAAGMTVLAVTNSHPAHALRQADRIVNSLEGITPEMLSAWFSN